MPFCNIYCDVGQSVPGNWRFGFWPSWYHLLGQLGLCACHLASVDQFSYLHLGDHATFPAWRHGIWAVDYLSSLLAAKWVWWVLKSHLRSSYLQELMIKTRSLALWAPTCSGGGRMVGWDEGSEPRRTMKVIQFNPLSSQIRQQTQGGCDSLKMTQQIIWLRR